MSFSTTENRIEADEKLLESVKYISFYCNQMTSCRLCSMQDVCGSIFKMVPSEIHVKSIERKFLSNINELKERKETE